MPITPNEILEKEFKKALRGYSVEEVDDFLEMVADVLADTIKERNLLRERVHELEGEVSALKAEEKEIKKMLLSAQKLIDELKAQAEREAEIIIEEAKAKGEKILEEAREEERRLRGLILELQRHRISWASEFKAMLRKYLDMLEQEPDFMEKELKKKGGKRASSVDNDAEILKPSDLEGLISDNDFDL